MGVEVFHVTDVSAFHEAMADCHRRRILYALATSDDQCQVSVQPGGDVIPGPDTRRKRSRLLHVHLPKLADYGYVEWELGSFAVTRGSAFAEIRPLLVALGEQTGQLFGG